MRTLVDYIFETSDVNLNLTEEELLADLEAIDDWGVENNTKKALAAKYKLTSKKAADIKDAILKQLRVNRHNKKIFTQDDIKHLNMIGVPVIYKKFVEVISLEPVEFIEYYKNELFRRLQKAKLDDKLWMASSRGVRIPSSDQYTMKCYLNVVQYLESIGKDSSGRDENATRQALHDMLISEMKEFHDALMKDVEKFAKEFWKKLPSYIEDAKSVLDNARERYYKIDHESCELHNSGATRTPEGKARYKEVEELRKSYKKEWEKADRKVSKYLAIERRFGSESKYVEESLKDAERDYQYNINSITERVEKQNFNIPETRLSDIKRDPKFFEFVITDGTKKMYCRSIRAAELSTKVTPHFRFIITNRKQ